MTGEKSAVIIGAGIGGITTAIYLAKEGYVVNVYEKNSSPGGRCGQLLRDGHRFDLGATMLMMPGIYREVFHSLGIPLFENDDVMPLADLYKIYFDNNEVIAFSPDENKMKIQLEKIEHGSFEKSQKYVTTGYEIFQIGINKLIDLITPLPKRDNGAGQWNRATIILNGNHVEHWLNGQKTVEYERGNDAWRALVAKSKYKIWPKFGEAAEGHILLQEHGNAVSFKNVKIKVL